MTNTRKCVIIHFGGQKRLAEAFVFYANRQNGGKEMSSTIGFANEEAAVMELSRMYRQFGFKHFKMSKFEEYDLYAQNKDFLLGSSVITFTDKNGALMALKPDVTLSIVKGSNDSFTEPEKVYYSENVYRVDKGTHRFKEIMQLGLECIGEIGAYETSEVILLAKKSLDAVCPRNILDISHMGFLLGLLDGENLSEKKRGRLIECIRSKNTLEMEKLAASYGVSYDTACALKKLTGIYGSFEKCVGELKEISKNELTDRAVSELESVYSFLEGCGFACGVNLDFSIVSDMNYYNGVIFNGFIDGVPNAVLSGGRYDNLMRKFGKRSGAVGFAVYLDQLERMMRSDEPYDVDVLLLYGGDDDLPALAKAVTSLTQQGKSVRAQKYNGESVKYRTLMRINGTEVETVETDD